MFTAMLCAVTMALGTSPDAKPAEEQFKMHPVEEQIVQFTNAERSRYGLPELQIDQGLMQTARQHATWMTVNQSMVHTRLPLAENIAMGQPSAQHALQSWMGSSGHRANILNPGHRRIGVAAFQAVNGVIFWCQQFMP
jgi:uncharacterized protein YkwD